MTHNYKACIEDSNKHLPDLKGALLNRLLINVVTDEFNVVYLETDKGVFALHGKMGGEYLGVHPLPEMPVPTEQEGVMICPYPPFNGFLGQRISQVRQIGSAWNGHGYELSFKDVLNKTMIVQSIHSGDKPDDLEDCLRLGVGHYENRWKKR